MFAALATYVAHQVWDLISAVPFVIGDGQLRLTASIACGDDLRLRV